MTKENKQFDEMISIIYKDMISRKDDKSVKRMKTINSAKLPQIMPLQGVYEYAAKSALTYPELYDKFKGGEWDHKVDAKKVVDSYYSKESKNATGQPVVIFGSKFPGDDKNIYDHDLWGNISYGYTMKAAGFKDWENIVGAKIDDGLQSLRSDKSDKIDDPMVKFGMGLYDKYEAEGKVMTEEDLRRELLANEDILRRYKKEELSDRRSRTQEGDDVAKIAQKYGLTADQLIEYNEQHKQGVKGLNKEQSLLPNTKPIIPTQQELFAMQQTKLPNSQDQSEPQPESKSQLQSILSSGSQNEDLAKELQSNKEKMLRAIEDNDNKKTDILYKHPSQISESEVRESMRYAGYETKDPEIRKLLDGKNQEWYDYYYSKDLAKKDATGRTIAEEAKYKAPEEVSELKTKDNIAMSTAFKKVAEEAAPFGVRSLQKGLNEMNGVKLKEDGELGPKTTLGLKDILAKNGLNEVSKNIKYGGFATMLEDNRKQAVDKDNLNKMMTTLRPQDGGLFLQQGLNKVGANKAGYERLKEDNDIGDKTTGAFNKVKEEDEAGLSSYFKDNMAKDIEKTREMEELERQKEYEKEQRELARQREMEERERERAEIEAQKQRQLEEEQKLAQMQNQSLQSASMIQ